MSENKIEDSEDTYIKIPKNVGKNYRTVFWIAGINILIFAITQIYGDWYYLAERMAMTPIKVYNDKWLWIFVTYMFIHGNWLHVIINACGISIFGYYVEKQLGSKDFLSLFFTTGILCGIFSFIVYLIIGDHWIALIGSGGAMYALMLTYAVFFPDTVVYLYNIIPLRTPIVIIIFIAVEIFSIITSRNVTHLTNLSGFVFAWLYIVVHYGINPWKNIKLGNKVWKKLKQ